MRERQMPIRINYRAVAAVVVFVLLCLVLSQGSSTGPAEADFTGEFGERDGRLMKGEYRRALQYAGSGERVQRFLTKASRGEPLTVSVVGGSVSLGRGLRPASGLTRRDSPDNEQAESGNTTLLERRAGAGHSAPTLYSPENMHVVVFNWIRAIFPNPDHRFVNGAQGAVGAEYFGWCFKEHISEDADLVIVELGINDLVTTSGYAAYERLIRSVLEMKNKPAVINIETFTLLFSPIISASAVHQDICAFYDIPSISLRDVLLPRILADPDAEIPYWFRTEDGLSLKDPKVREYGGQAVDMMHISAYGHGLAADLMIHYLQTQLRRVENRRYWWNAEKSGDQAPSVPSTLLTGAYDPLKPIPISVPVCRSMNSAHLHRDTAQEENEAEGSAGATGTRGLVLAEGSHGWTEWAWKEKRYLIAKLPGATAKFNFVASSPSYPPPPRLPEYRRQGVFRRPNRERPLIDRQKRAAMGHSGQADPGDTSAEKYKRGGTVALAYQRSKIFGLGRVSCWVDEEVENAMVVDGHWEIQERNMGLVTEIASGLEPGPHTLTCELQEQTSDPAGRTEFRIIAVMHD